MFKAFEEKMEEIRSELGKLKMDVIGLTETERRGTGSVTVGGYIRLYSGVSKDRRPERGVSIRKATNERNLNEGQWEDRKQGSLGVGQRRTMF